MWEPVCRLTQCGHRQRAWYRSWGSRFKSLSNLWGWHTSVKPWKDAGRAGRGWARSRECPGGWKCPRKEMVWLGGLPSFPRLWVTLNKSTVGVGMEAWLSHWSKNPLGGRGREQALPQPPPDQLHIHLIHTLDPGRKFLFVIAIPFLGFVCFFVLN